MVVRRISNDELYHHGIKGQKWGVRRYQNPDGSLTPEGYVHYGYATPKKDINGKIYGYGLTKKGTSLYINPDSSLTEKGKEVLQKYYKDIKSDNSHLKEVEKQKREAGIIKQGKNEQLAKGSKMQRLANGDESLDEKRKYVFLTENDKIQYTGDWEFFDNEYETGKRQKLYTYEAKKDLKIASKEEVYNYIMDNFRDKKVSEVMKESNNTSEISKQIVENMRDLKIKDVEKLYEKYKNFDAIPVEYNNIDSQFAISYGLAVTDVISKTLSSIDNKTFNDRMVKHYIKKGYDAVVDANDAFTYSDYPLIILNPKSSIKSVGKVETW